MLTENAERGKLWGEKYGNSKCCAFVLTVSAVKSFRSARASVLIIFIHRNINSAANKYKSKNLTR